MSRGGAEYELRHGPYTAVVTQVGAGIRRLTHEDRDLVRPYGRDEIRPRYRGALLAPWPNRVVDGTYRFDGQELQLDLSEPERGHALHGLVSWERFDAVSSSDTRVDLAHAVVPRVGYPFSVELEVSYGLGDGGLTCTVTARNCGDRRAPYGTAPHPYLWPGPGRVDDWVLTLPAERVQEVTPDRLVPTGLRDVEGTPFDFREGRRVGRTEIDHAYTALTADVEGMVTVRVVGADGHGTEVAWDPGTLPWVQIHTADLPQEEESRRGLAVEPMTCPPDAFNSGTDLVVLEPGQTHRASWTLRAV